jgi:segregation and condensation protein B
MEIEDQKQEIEETAAPEQLVLGAPGDDAGLKAAIEAIVYVCEEPATAAQLAGALGQPEERVNRLIAELVAEYAGEAHGLMIREVAGGYKMATKPEHHEAVRAFAKSLKPSLKLSLAALETLATIAYKQPITAPEIMDIRGVQGAGVLKTLLDRKLIQTAGRKNVVGRPILYRTSKEFLLQFGLKDLTELPTLKEFEELKRLATGDESDAGERTPETAQGAAEETALEPAEGAASETAGETPQEPADEAALETAGETPQEPADEAASETAGETPQEPAGDAAQEPAEDAGQEPADPQAPETPEG